MDTLYDVCKGAPALEALGAGAVLAAGELLAPAAPRPTVPQVTPTLPCIVQEALMNKPIQDGGDADAPLWLNQPAKCA